MHSNKNNDNIQCQRRKGLKLSLFSLLVHICSREFAHFAPGILLISHHNIIISALLNRGSIKKGGKNRHRENTLVFQKKMREWERSVVEKREVDGEEKFFNASIFLYYNFSLIISTTLLLHYNHHRFTYGTAGAQKKKMWRGNCKPDYLWIWAQFPNIMYTLCIEQG